MFPYFIVKVTFPFWVHGGNRTIVNSTYLYPGSFITQISFNWRSNMSSGWKEMVCLVWGRKYSKTKAFHLKEIATSN